MEFGAQFFDNLQYSNISFGQIIATSLEFFGLPKGSFFGREMGPRLFQVKSRLVKDYDLARMYGNM